MRTMNLLKLTAAALFLVSGAATAQQIADTKHDLGTGAGNATDNGQICVYCHTPHNASLTIPTPPLWNKVLTAESFDIYGSSTIQNVTGQPEGTSLACLTCHDGTLALDAMINPPTGFTPDNNTMGAVAANLGTNLSNDHPISIGYSLAADGAFVDPSAVTAILPLFPGTQDATYQVECASCHNVHNESGADYLLVKSNAGSALCLTCHNK
jgi:predicted CXXCH cytochrome family protein